MSVDLSWGTKFSETALSEFVGKYITKAGLEFLVLVFKLYYLIKKDGTSKAVAAAALAALGYTVCPIDAIPDFTPIVGLTDDLGVLTATVAALASSITPDIVNQATLKANSLLR